MSDTDTDWQLHQSEREAEALRHADRDRRAFPRHWREWERVRPLLITRWTFDGWDRAEYGFAAFRAELGEGPPRGRVVRRDRAKGFEPGNLRWKRRPLKGPAATVFVRYREAREVYGLSKFQFYHLAETVGGVKAVRRSRLDPPAAVTRSPSRRLTRPAPGLVSYL